MGKAAFQALKLFLKPFRPSLCVLKNDQEVFYSLEKDLGHFKIFLNSSISPSSSWFACLQATGSRYQHSKHGVI